AHGLHEQRRGERHVLVLALLLGVLDLLELVTAEDQLELLGEVLDWGDLLEHFLQSLRQEPLERRPLHADEVRERQDLLELGEAEALSTRNQDVRQEGPPPS